MLKRFIKYVSQNMLGMLGMSFTYLRIPFHIKGGGSRRNNCAQSGPSAV